MTTTDIITLAALTALFAVFAATMAWAEMLTRRHIAAQSPCLRRANVRDHLSKVLC